MPKIDPYKYLGIKERDPDDVDLFGFFGIDRPAEHAPPEGLGEPTGRLRLGQQLGEFAEGIEFLKTDVLERVTGRPTSPLKQFATREAGQPETGPLPLDDQERHFLALQEQARQPGLKGTLTGPALAIGQGIRGVARFKAVIPQMAFGIASKLVAPELSIPEEEQKGWSEDVERVIGEEVQGLVSMIGNAVPQLALGAGDFVGQAFGAEAVAPEAVLSRIDSWIAGEELERPVRGGRGELGRRPTRSSYADISAAYETLTGEPLDRQALVDMTNRFYAAPEEAVFGIHMAKGLIKLAVKGGRVPFTKVQVPGVIGAGKAFRELGRDIRAGDAAVVARHAQAKVDAVRDFIRKDDFGRNQQRFLEETIGLQERSGRRPLEELRTEEQKLSGDLTADTELVSAVNRLVGKGRAGPRKSAERSLRDIEKEKQRRKAPKRAKSAAEGQRLKKALGAKEAKRTEKAKPAPAKQPPKAPDVPKASLRVDPVDIAPIKKNQPAEYIAPKSGKVTKATILSASKAADGTVLIRNENGIQRRIDADELFRVGSPLIEPSRTKVSERKGETASDIIKGGGGLAAIVASFGDETPTKKQLFEIASLGFLGGRKGKKTRLSAKELRAKFEAAKAKPVKGLPVKPPAIPPPSSLPAQKGTVSRETTTPSKGFKPVGLSKAEVDQVIKEYPGLKELPPARRKSWEENYSNAKAGNLDESALAIAKDVVRKKRPLTSEESAGIALRAADRFNELDKSQARLEAAKKRGDSFGVGIERAHSENLLEELNILHEGARSGNREAARTMNIAKSLIDRESFELSKVLGRARVAKGEKLSTKQTERMKELVTAHKELGRRYAELELEFNKTSADRQRLLAQKVATGELKLSKSIQRKVTAKQKLVGERADIKKQIAELGFRVNDITGVTPEAAFLIGKLATNYIKEGALSLDQTVAQVIKDVPQLTESDVYRSLIAKNPKIQRKARTEATKQVTLIKQQARLLVEIEKLEAGIVDRPKAKSPTKPELRELQKKAQELRKIAYRSIRDADRFEKALSTLDRLEDNLANGLRDVKKKRPVEPAELTEIKKQIAQVRKHMNMQDELARLQKQIEAGDFEVPKEVVKEPLPPEMERLQVELAVARKRIRGAVEELAPWTTKRQIAEGVNFLRTLKATADMSATFRQAFPLIARRPLTTGKNFAKAFKAFFSEYTAEAIDHAIRSNDGQYLRDRSKLDLSQLDGKPTAREEFISSGIAEKIPALGKVIRASNRHMVTFLNLMRVDAFDQFVRKYPNATRAELDAWANTVNVFSGRGDLVKGGPILGALAFAPRFAASRIQGPFQIVRPSIWTQPRVRNEVALDMIYTLGLGSSILTMAHFAGFEVGLDPEESDWGKIRIGNTRIDIWGGFQQPMRAIVRLGMWGTGTATRRADWEEIVTRFARYKASPLINLAEEAITGESVVGEERTLPESVLRSLTPIIIEGIVDAYREEGLGEAAIAGGADFVGIGANTYKDRKSRIRRDIKKAIRKGDIGDAYSRQLGWNILYPNDLISDDWISKAINNFIEKGD